MAALLLEATGASILLEISDVGSHLVPDAGAPRVFDRFASRRDMLTTIHPISPFRRSWLGRLLVFLAVISCCIVRYVVSLWLCPARRSARIATGFPPDLPIAPDQLVGSLTRNPCTVILTRTTGKPSICSTAAFAATIAW